MLQGGLHGRSKKSFGKREIMPNKTVFIKVYTQLNDTIQNIASVRDEIDAAINDRGLKYKCLKSKKKTIKGTIKFFTDGVLKVEGGR